MQIGRLSLLLRQQTVDQVLGSVPAKITFAEQKIDLRSMTFGDFIEQFGY
jgi:hypothetical protein